jgi:topoisomerase-4 subunit A
LTIMKSGHYRLTGIDLSTKFDDDMIIIEKWNTEKPISAIYYDPEKDQYYIKRFLVEDSDKLVHFISETEGSKLEWVGVNWRPMIELKFDQRGGAKENELVNVEETIAVKGLKAQGNRIAKNKIKTIDTLEPLPHEDEVAAAESDATEEGEEDLKENDSTETEDKEPETTSSEPPAAKTEKPNLAIPKKEEKPEEAKEKAEVPKSETEETKEDDSTSKKPKLSIKAKNKDDDDSFGAGSQITLEL